MLTFLMIRNKGNDMEPKTIPFPCINQHLNQ